MIEPRRPAFRIRPEQPGDAEAIDRIHRRAFEGPGEAELVARLRRTGSNALSLVAEADGGTVGHILFTAVTVEENPDEVAVLGLAPVAVLPEFQRRAIGAGLIEAGLSACGDMGAGGVVVLGHAEYYPRFGFLPASGFGLRCTYPVPDEFFMAQELRVGAFARAAGMVHYHQEFDRIE